MDNTFSTEEYLKFTNILKMYNGIFYKFWLIGKPIINDKISTAAISFSKEGNAIHFNVNINFWNNLNDSQKAFIICHECLHIIFNHGKRFMTTKDHVKANIAMDIVINHKLVDDFLFRREEIDPENNYCWIDTVFKDYSNISKNESFEYYYNKLVNDSDNVNNDYGNLVDDHSFLEEAQFEEIGEIVINELDEDEKEQFNDMKSETYSSIKLTIDVEPIKKKKKWETVIKKWSKKYLNNTTKLYSQWARINRRFVLVDDEIILPSEMEIDMANEDKTKIDVWFFQDTSGSCHHLAKRFFKAARSLPPEKFNIRMFCFDTRVYETDLKTGQLYGFGGTSFYIIEREIQKIIKREKVEYPKAVFVITDGYGDHVYPIYPERWYWFLSTNSTHCIPKKSNIFKLADFE